jgi:predicted P-loop ATPase
MKSEDMQKPCKDIRDIESLNAHQVTDRKIIKALYNTYDDEFERERVCERLLARAKEFNSEVLVKDFILELKDRDLKKKEAIEEKNRKLEWHLEVRRRYEAQARKKLEKKRAKELEEYTQNLEKEKRNKELEEYNKNISDALEEDFYKNNVDKFVFTKDGNLAQNNVSNYDLIMQNDRYIKEHIRFNEFTHCLEFDGETMKNGELLGIISYLDRVYKIHDDKFIWNALNRPGNISSYHPIKNIIEYDKWDGVERIDEFFHTICDVDTSSSDMKVYAREVARMLFFGGIKRLYEPGSKFDYMVIFEGRQGTCKSTLARLLALDDEAYTEVTTIEGQQGIENISGSWICEFAELLAMVRAREVEAIKAFITRQYDKYRPPYAHTAEVVPRSCIFIGTTNDVQFMSDLTGNRRYLPISININASNFFKNIDEIKEYILNCWREAFYKYMNEDIYTTIPAEYNEIVENVRGLYTDDNPLEGLIRNYIDSLPKGYKLCSLEIYTKCCNGIRTKFTTRDARQIAVIMNKMYDWQRTATRESFGEYGQQRYWIKKVGMKKDEQVQNTE